MDLKVEWMEIGAAGQWICGSWHAVFTVGEDPGSHESHCDWWGEVL